MYSALKIEKVETIKNVGKKVEEGEPLHTVGGYVNPCSHYRKEQEGPQNIKISTTKGPSNTTSKNISDGSKINIGKKYLHPQVHCSTIYSSQAMGAT